MMKAVSLIVTALSHELLCTLMRKASVVKNTFYYVISICCFRIKLFASLVTHNASFFHNWLTLVASELRVERSFFAI